MNTASYSPLDADFLGFHHYLTAEERGSLAQLRTFLEAEAAPVVAGMWERAEFPHALVKPLAELSSYAFGYEETQPFANSAVFRGFRALELARIDASLSTFVGVHSGLAMGSVALCGSAAQRAEWLPKMSAGEVIGCFGLTEPEHGSDVAGGLETTARRDGDEWVLNGAKRWIGNGTWCDIGIIWAKDEADGQVLGFIVPTDTPGFSSTKIEGKYSLRIVQNADLTLRDVRVGESLRLQGANSFRDTNQVLKLTRLEVAFCAIGNAIGAYEAARAYAAERKQFGKELGRFQLVQDLLAKSPGNITSALSLAVAVARMRDEDRQDDKHSAMAKLMVLNQCREVVSWCRELLGGNGIVLDYDVMRRFVDAEAQYSFEGTREVNTLIIGREITGYQAFV